MNHNVNRFLIAFCMVLLYGSSQATNYYTLNPGDYSDVNGVWSLDGSNPCLCAPPATLSATTDSLFINHDIVLNAGLNLNGGAYLSIGATANVSSPGLVRADGGVIVNAGNFSPSTLQIFNGRFTSTGSVDVTGGSFFNFNSTTDISGYMHVSLDFRVFNGSTFTLRTNSSLVVDGFFFNSGNVITEPGACIDVAGDFFSSEQGNIIGSGHIAADFNITSNGFWDPNTSWCAGVTGFGLPTPPNCINCGPLPVTLAAFQAAYKPADAAVDLTWTTSSEVNNDHFIVEHSMDGVHFTQLATVQSNHLNGAGGRYEIRDEKPAEGMNYYRLTQVDKSGQTQVLETEKVFANGTQQSSFVLYPNPANGPVNYQLSLEEAAQFHLVVTDLAGRIVLERHADSASAHSGQIDGGALDSGIYLLRIQAGTFSSSSKLTIRK